MAFPAMATAQKPASVSLTTIHVADLAPGPSGAVYWGKEISEQEAVKRRKAGLDIVVRGNDNGANNQIAKKIETHVGLWIPHFPHISRGQKALPHIQQISGTPRGHSFYEVNLRKAVKKP